MRSAFLRDALASMARADLVALPVHTRGTFIVYLHTVGADVPVAGSGVAADDEREG